MGLTEYALLALVILVPLVIAGAVTLWSLKQVEYRPKKRRPAQGQRSEQTKGSGGPPSERAAS